MVCEVNQIELPNDLAQIRDALVSHLHSDGPKPAGLDELREWLLDEGWAGVSEKSEIMMADDIICLDPSQLEHLELSHEALRSEMDLDDDEPITDEMRLESTVEALNSAYDGELSGGFASWCWPMVHVGQLVGCDEKFIVTGILTRFQGSGALHVPEWCEFFRDREGLIEHLERSGFIVNMAPEKVDPRILLSAWEPVE